MLHGVSVSQFPSLTTLGDRQNQSWIQSALQQADALQSGGA